MSDSIDEFVVRQPPHAADLFDVPQDDVLAPEWDCYRRDYRRLLAEGHEGDWVVIKGQRIIGIWPTRAQAKQAAVSEFLLQPVLIHQIRANEPIYRIGSFGRLWRS